jgi:DNA-binding transcriptional regulator YdaS (Cro superfamily)
MDITAVIQHFGSQSALAEKLGVTKASVSKWARAGRIPPRRAYEIERITGGLFAAALDTSYHRGEAA